MKIGYTVEYTEAEIATMYGVFEKCTTAIVDATVKVIDRVISLEEIRVNAAAKAATELERAKSLVLASGATIVTETGVPVSDCPPDVQAAARAPTPELVEAFRGAVDALSKKFESVLEERDVKSKKGLKKALSDE